VDAPQVLSSVKTGYAFSAIASIVEEDSKGAPVE
jgi:hypothetical protein